MADNFILRDFDPDDFRRELVKELAAQIVQIMAAHEPGLKDRQGAAEQLGIGVATLDKLVAEGRIPSILAGRRQLFDVRECIEAMRNGGA